MPSTRVKAKQKGQNTRTGQVESDISLHDVYVLIIIEKKPVQYAAPTTTTTTIMKMLEKNLDV